MQAVIDYSGKGKIKYIPFPEVLKENINLLQKQIQLNCYLLDMIEDSQRWKMLLLNIVSCLQIMKAIFVGRL